MKRSVYIVVRFTRAERRALRDKAGEVRTTVSDLVRVKCLEGLRIGREEDPRQLELYGRRGAVLHPRGPRKARAK